MLSIFRVIILLVIATILTSGCATQDANTVKLNELEREVDRLRRENEKNHERSANALLAEEVRKLRKELEDSRENHPQKFNQNAPNNSNSPNNNLQNQTYRRIIGALKVNNEEYKITFFEEGKVPFIATLDSPQGNASGTFYGGVDGGQHADQVREVSVLEDCSEKIQNDREIMPLNDGKFIVIRDEVLCIIPGDYPMFIVDTKLVASDNRFLGLIEFIIWKISIQDAKKIFLDSRSS